MYEYGLARFKDIEQFPTGGIDFSHTLPDGLDQTIWN